MSDAPQWIGCGEAERLVRQITGELPDSFKSFASLLKLAQQGLIRATATTSECDWGQPNRTFLDDDITYDVFSLDAADGCPKRDYFYRELEKRYGSKTSHSGHYCFLTGSFNFSASRYDLLSESDCLPYYKVIGLRFSRSDIIENFGQPSVSNAYTSTSKKVRGGGRPPKWKWDDALIHLIAVANGKDGLHFEDQPNASHIARLLEDWFSENNEGDSPAFSELWKIGSKVMTAIENLKLAGS